MTLERLISLAMLSINKYIASNLDYDVVVNEFA